MPFRYRTTFIMPILLLFCTVAFSQNQWPHTLLWKISGNGLSKPSYLYGTIHMQDERLFHFGDSVYRCLERADGLALEISFRDMMDSILARSVQKTEQSYLKKEDEAKVDTRALGKSADSILKKYGIAKGRITQKQLKQIRDARMSEMANKGDMPTIVDGYLYGIALRQGKWLGGIEDAQDQLGLLDEMGSNLDATEVFESQTKLKSYFEELIRLYSTQDLGGIEDFSYHHTSPFFVNNVLIRRNLKMAQRMDSMARIRSMFFAIGAAHLPGDSGVISTLRKRGFSVEPVFSTQKLSATAYAAKLNTLPWFRTQDDKSLYTIETPGEPSDLNIFGEAMKMKFYFDLTSMTYYLAGSTLSGVKDSKGLEAVLENIKTKMSTPVATLSGKTAVSQNGADGIEGTIETPAASFRVRLLLKDRVMYLLMAGSNKKSALSNPDIERYFKSFSPLASERKDWVTFSLPEKGFSVSMPGQPKHNKAFESQYSAAWKLTVYDYADLQRGCYFIVKIQEVKPGNFVSTDSSFFAAYRSNFKGKAEAITTDRTCRVQGFPALQYNGISQNLLFKTLTVLRGGRVYTIFVTGTGQADSTLANDFIQSFKLQDYPPTAWKAYSSEAGFRTTAPGSILTKEADTLWNGDIMYHYLSFDTTKTISYDIFKSPQNEYYYTSNDSDFFTRSLKGAYSTDSIIEHHKTKNGSLSGMEAVIRIEGHSDLKKIRAFLNGDTLYTLVAHIPQPYLAEKENEQFFENFRVAKEYQPSLFINKSKQLFDALRSTDSTRFSKASTALGNIEFTEKELPYLHEGLLSLYRDSASYYGAHNKIAKALEKLKHPSTVAFIRNNYGSLNGEKERLKYSLLKLLAEYKTPESYKLLKELLLSGVPAKGYPGTLTYSLYDSLPLTRSLYPEILSLSADSHFNEVLVPVTNRLLDSSLLPLTELLPYENAFLHEAEKGLKTPNDDWWRTTALLSLAGKFNDARSNKLLSNYLKLESLDIKESAIVALAHNRQPIDPKALEAVAGDRMHRLPLYEALKNMKQQSIFPPKYNTQKSLAESELSIALSEDDEMELSAISFLEERVVDYKGQKQKFLLYKVSYPGNEGTDEQHLGITGPYKLQEKDIVLHTDIPGIYYKETLEKTETERQLKEYLGNE